MVLSGDAREESLWRGHRKPIRAASWLAALASERGNLTRIYRDPWFRSCGVFAMIAHPRIREFARFQRDPSRDGAGSAGGAVPGSPVAPMPHDH